APVFQLTRSPFLLTMHSSSWNKHCESPVVLKTSRVLNRRSLRLPTVTAASPDQPRSMPPAIASAPILIFGRCVKSTALLAGFGSALTRTEQLRFSRASRSRSHRSQRASRFEALHLQRSSCAKGGSY